MRSSPARCLENFLNLQFFIARTFKPTYVEKSLEFLITHGRVISMKIYFLFATLIFLAFDASAKDAYVDLRNVNIVGKVNEITSPNILKVETDRNGKRQHFWIELVQVDFGNDRNRECSTGNKTRQMFRNLTSTAEGVDACDYMDDWLDGEIVSVEITEWSEPVLKGFVFIGTTNVNYDLIEKGRYPVDYMQTRDASLALLEKKARCQRVGIWKSKMGVPEEDMKCQD
jgi:hypothetical protein